MRLPLLLSVLALAGCTNAELSHTGSDNVLARELAGRVGGSPQACISKFGQANLRVIDGRTVAYDAGATLWVSRLAADCPALDRYNTLIVEGSGSEYCRGDRLRGLEPGALIPGPICILRDFTPYRLSGGR